MRTLSLILLCALAGTSPAGELRFFDDATLRAVQFIDAREGWAVGDEGVVWHTIDGGVNWERLPTGVGASLRSLHFLTPYVGWVVGREELPGGRSGGVVLYTDDGGLKWRRVLVNALPGLHVVRFVDSRTGYMAGDSSTRYPTGIFSTTDGGQNWQPIAGKRASSWRGGDFNKEGGVLGGAWNRLATVRGGKLFSVDMDTLGGRTLCGVQMRGDGGVAVGQGGLVLLSSKSRGATWHFANLKLPREVQSSWDFHAVGGVNKHIWAVGRPGSAALHSSDGGQSWRVVKTGQTMPLHGVFFRDEKTGWAVGELGTILATVDGGKTWKTRQQGGARMAGLSVHGRPQAATLDTVSVLGGQDGYLWASVALAGPDSASAALKRVGEGCRFATAVREAGGATGEVLWQFPLASHQMTVDKVGLLKAWNATHGDRAAEQLLRQLVLAIRLYQPEVILTDDTEQTGLEALTAEAVREAFKKAGDESVFPEQIKVLGLSAWKAKKLYARCTEKKSQVSVDLGVLRPVLGAGAREFCTPALALLGEGVPPAERHFRLLADHLAGSAGHKHLMQGITLAPGCFARRLIAPCEISDEQIQAVRKRANLWAIASAPASELTSNERLLAQVGSTLKDMPQAQAAPAAFALARHYARAGQWELARETFLLLVERYPTHPLAADGYRWLLMHAASSEARRRHELGQFLVVGNTTYGLPTKPSQVTLIATDKEGKKKTKKIEVVSTETQKTRELAYLTTKDDVRRWYQGALSLESKLAAFGPLFADDPGVQFCVQSARRNLGDIAAAKKWYSDFVTGQPDGPWKQAAQAELWLMSRVGPAPKPVITCQATGKRPFLDGKLADDCWKSAKVVKLSSATGDTREKYPTEVRLTHDKDFLYVGVKCGHPAGQVTAPAKVKERDGDLRKHDRVSILLDLDRDYATWFRLECDARGCVAEDCWGDRSWNPRWFVAIQRESTGWTMEAAIPLVALTGDRPTAGRAWAANVVRTLPGQGVQALSLPAEATVRPEGMGLLIFQGEPKQAATR